MLLLLPSLFGACGGDSGGQSDDPTGPSGSNQAPSVSISQPAADTSIGQSYSSTFEGAASDAEDGDLSGSSLVWESDRDGRLGTGQFVSFSGLSMGQHTITLTATDSDGSSSSATVGAAVVDVASADTLLTDACADSLVASFTASKQAAVDSALSDCDTALSDGDVPLLETCLNTARFRGRLGERSERPGAGGGPRPAPRPSPAPTRSLSTRIPNQTPEGAPLQKISRHVRASAFIAVALALALALPGTARAQSTTYTACYVPDAGAVYMIGQQDTPSSCLESSHVEFTFGGMYMETSSTDGRPFYGYATGGAAEAYEYFDGGSSKWHLYNGGVRMTVERSGDVGIGTMTPTATLSVDNTSGSNQAARFVVSNSSNASQALRVETDGTGEAARVSINDGGNTDQAFLLGAFISAYDRTSSASNLRFEVANDGNVTADGTISGGSADVAEAFDVEGSAESYEPGDVLVTAETPGHAMKAEPKVIEGMEIYPQGAIIGKALQAFDGHGTGKIEVMVNVK